MADAEPGGKKKISLRQFHVLMVQMENLGLFQVYLKSTGKKRQFRLWNVIVIRQTVILLFSVRSPSLTVNYVWLPEFGVAVLAAEAC